MMIFSGGIRQDAEVVWSLRGIIRAASPELCLCQQASHLPFIIPDADGTFQFTYSQCMVFCKHKGSAEGGRGASSASISGGSTYVDEGDSNYATPPPQQ
jgi:hypothetical protein